MREIEHILRIRGKMTVPEEIARFDDAEGVIEDSFRKMLSGTAAYMLDGRKSPVEIGEVWQALRFIGDCAKRVDVDFYDFPTEDTVRRYVLKLGIEVVMNREYAWDLRTPVEDCDS